LTTSTPDLKPEVKRAMLALWLSLAVHAAVIGLIRVTPRTMVAMDQVLEARLENPSHAQPDQEAAEMPLLDANTDLQTLITVQDEQPIVFQPLPEIKAESRLEHQPEPSPQPLAANPVSEPVRPNNPDPAKNQPGPSIDIPLAVDTQYYAAKELDVQPRPVRKIEPAYPPEYESQGASGYAILEMRVESDGEISDLKVVEIFPSSHDAFGREALEAFRNARFIPAKRKGQQVRALFRVKVVFESADNAN
jgi:protein TonB